MHLTRHDITGGCYTAIISPEGVPLCEPMTEGEGMAIADLDFSLITKRKRMMDSVGHYSRPDLLQLQVNTSQRSVWQQTAAYPLAIQNNQDLTNGKSPIPEPLESQD